MVEDEALILEIMAETLEEAGYDVVTAQDGAAALALLDRHQGHVSALFSDYHLPGGLTGIDVARAVRRRCPGLPVIMATGRPDVLESEWVAAEAFGLLRKPYGPSELVAMMGRLLPPHHAGDGRTGHGPVRTT